MSRVLIAIGCNTFDDPSLTTLHGAENDASSIYDVLVNQEAGEFSADQSKLLLSPSLQEVRDAISDTLFTIDSIDCLTVFYAGHGEVKDGTYFMTCRDSYVDRLSLTGLSITALFSYINETKCSHTNIIIDACYAAGFVHDIGALIKPDIIGRRSAFSLSILAAASSDESASEHDGQGYCTHAILDCVSGKTAIPTSRSTLDLLDVGNAVAAALPVSCDQHPEYWGISLKGHVPFCKNPNSASEPDFHPTLPSDFDAISQNHADAIWAEYFKLDDDFDPQALLQLLGDASRDLSDYPEQAVSLALSVATSFSQKIANPNSGFLEAEINGAALTAIMRFVASYPDAEPVASDLCNRVFTAVEKGVSAINEQGEADKYFLLSSGFAELYYLPMRISKILGWIGAAIHIANAMEKEIDKAQVAALCAKIVEHYSTSVYSVSDAQAPHVASFVSAALSIGMQEEAELITSLMFNSFVQVRGRVTSTNVPPDQIMKYLMSTEHPAAPDLTEGVIARPSEMLAVFFVLYRMFGMHEELDACLSDLDYSHFVIYVPGKYSDFWNSVMIGGENHNFQVGHGIWRLSDFEGRWSAIQDEILEAREAPESAISLGAIVSSLVQPDRTPWFLLTDESRPQRSALDNVSGATP